MIETETPKVVPSKRSASNEGDIRTRTDIDAVDQGWEEQSVTADLKAERPHIMLERRGCQETRGGWIESCISV